MLVPLDKLKQLYNQLKQNAYDAESGGCTTCIFVANDTDAICALRMLTVSGYLEWLV